MRSFVLFCMLPVIALAQSYFEVSGQTVAFTLTAGAKAGWNSSISVEKTKVMPSFGIFRIISVGNGLFVHAGAKGIIKLFDVRGRMAVSLSLEHDGFVPLSRGLANGIYIARFEAPRMAVKTARLAVVR